MKKAILFDMDGLLIDSERVTFETYQEILTRMGYVFTKSMYQGFVGSSKETVRQHFYDLFGAQFPLPQVEKETHAIIEDCLFNHPPVKKGAMTLLSYLKKRQYKIMVASNSIQKRVVPVLKASGIDAYIDGYICGDQVSRGKPDPELYLACCQRLQISPKQALVLEDSEPGINAGYNAGIDVICVPDIKYPSQKYIDMTTHIVNSLEDVIAYLEQ